jgi:hypothetical protein
VDPQDQLKTGLAVDPFERSCDRVAGDAVVVDFPDLEKVLRNVVEAAQDNNVVFFEMPLGHEALLTNSRSGKTAPRVTLIGKGKVTGTSQPGKAAQTSKSTARVCGRAKDSPQRAFICHCKASRRAPPATASSVNMVNIMGSSFRV